MDYKKRYIGSGGNKKEHTEKIIPVKDGSGIKLIIKE